MGYCMNLMESTAGFETKNSEKILTAIQNLAGKETIHDSNGGHFSWVANNFYEIRDIEKIFEEWRWKIEKNGSDYKIAGFLGEKLGDENILFDAIAPYMNNGHIVMQGEDMLIWKWKFNHGRFREVNSRVIFEDEFHVNLK